MPGLVGMMERVVVRGHLLRGTHFGCEGWCEFREAGHDGCYFGGDMLMCMLVAVGIVFGEKTGCRRSRDAGCTSTYVRRW